MKRIISILGFISVCSKIWASVIISSYAQIEHTLPGSCNATEGGFYVEIKWHTSSQINTQWFQVWRTTDPGWSTSTSVGSRINACGFCFGNNYSVNDFGPFVPGVKYYYRVQTLSNSTLLGPKYSYDNLGSINLPVPQSKDWKSQVTLFAEVSTTPNSPNSYSWNEEPNIKQGVNINVIPTEVRAIYVEINNSVINFNTNISNNSALNFMTSIDVNYDNQGYVNIHQGNPVQGKIWNSASLFNSLGQHNLKVRWIDSNSGTIFNREYTVYVVETSLKFFKDNYCNDIRLWGGNDPNHEIPIILSEGFDANNIRTQEFYRYAGKNLIDCLIKKGFKVYILNYKYNSQDIRNNAAIYSSAIKYVSSINNNTPVIAAGMSMGGVIARYALAKAENDGNPLPVSKFVTMDSPHQGANISKELQDFIKAPGCSNPDNYSTNGLNNDAAKELLKYNAFDPSGNIHTNFYAELNALNGNGYPHLTRNIAVSFSNGQPNPSTGQLNNGLWCQVSYSGVLNLYAACGLVKDIFLTAEDIAAGSFLPLLTTTLDDKDVFWGHFGMQRYGDPTFIPFASSWDIVNGVSKFDVNLKTATTSYHDIVPDDIIEPLISAMLNDNLFLQNKTVTDTRNYIAGKKIIAGNNVISSLPVGDFIISAGANVEFKAGTEIALMSGFSAKSGSVFHATIAQDGKVAQCDGATETQSNLPVLKNIEGSIYTGITCGNVSVENDTIILTDDSNIRIPSVGYSVTDVNGEFNLDGFQLHSLNTNQRFRISAKSGLPMADTTSRTIADWISLNPISLTLKCPQFINGILKTSLVCGENPVPDDTLILTPIENIFTNSVVQTTTDANGVFAFDVTALDPLANYHIDSQSDFAINDTSSHKISEWVTPDPLFLSLSSIPENYFTKVETGDIVNLGRTTSSSWGDYDGDGDLDVIAFCNPANALYRNDCDGNFTQVTGNALSTPTTPFNSTPAEWIDYDNDGDLDIILYKLAGGTAVPQSAQLYQNDGSGNFTLITTGQMVNDTLSPRSASIVDFDNDGYLDVFVANRNRPNVLYRNTGAGDFIKVTGSILNSLCTPTLSQGSTWGDYDNDGDMDVYIGGGGAYSCFYQNNGNGTFTQNNDSLLTTVVGSNYGPAWVDYDNDSDLDLFLQIAFAPNLLFMNNNNGTFSKVTVAPFLNGNENAQGGPTFGDYDNDGDLDLFLANVNGHPNRFYVNNGDGTFTENINEIITNDVLKESFAATFADIDNDGDLDLYVNNVNNPYNDNHNFLYENKGSCNNWVKIKCIGSQTNKQAVGARVYVKATINGVQTIQMREINGNCNLTGGANGVTANEAHFGLGNAISITELKIVWPKSGITQIFNNVQLDKFYDVTETDNQILIHNDCNNNPASVAKKKNTGHPSVLNNNQIVESPLLTNNLQSLAKSIRVYPNPNSGTITVELNRSTNTQTPTEFRLFNMTGQLVFTKNLRDSNNSIDLMENGVESGMYYFTISSTGTTVKQDKLVVIK